METAKLKKFAQSARRSLIEHASSKLKMVLTESSAARRENAEAIKKLEEQITRHGLEYVVEKVAYIWFNRFCALRFMDVNRYTRVGVVSPAEGQSQPEILAEAKMGHVDEDMVPEKIRQQIFSLLSGTAPSHDPQGEAYRLLVVAVCNDWNKAMPFLFGRIADYTELLMPDDLLSGNSVLAQTREAMTPEDCQNVEVIGWLYQFYISEKKDEVFAELKKNKKITPANIPAATQLFTPHWIVRYLVENSLGRLWMLNRPNSKLIDRMEYYIRPDTGQQLSAISNQPENSADCTLNADGRSLSMENDIRSETGNQLSAISNQPKNSDGCTLNTDNCTLSTANRTLSTDYLKISSPEEIRVCDPACGSGHMLVYAFDLLYAIYEEEGYEPAEIPEKILSHNLYGIEIDERAGELAAFALTMKARAKHRRFFSKRVTPNICVLENIVFDENELKNYMDFVGWDLFTAPLQTTLRQFEETDNFGSLICPGVTNVHSMMKILDETNVTGQLFLNNTHQKVLKVLRQADYLSPKYHVVVANPPYMGGKGMNGRLGTWAKDNYPNSKSDLFAMFIERGFDMILPQGYSAMVTMQSWMFLSSYEKLREQLLNQVTIECMAHMANMVMGIAFGTAATVWRKEYIPGYKGAFCYIEYEDIGEGDKPVAFPPPNERNNAARRNNK